MVSFPSSIFNLTDFSPSETLDQAHGGFGHVESHNAVVDEVSAAQTKLGTGVSTPTTIGHVLSVTGTGATAYQHAALSRVENSLGADVNLNNTSTFFDGPSVSLTAGTWLLVGHVAVLDSAGPASIISRLWDGTTVEDQGIVTTPAASFFCMIPVSGIVTVGSTTTYKISVKDLTGTTGVMKAASEGVGSASASSLRAVRIA